MHQEVVLPRSLKWLRSFDFPHKLGICERLFGKRLGRLGTQWVRCANGLIWKLDLSDSCHRWCVFGDYEGPVQARWIRRWLEPGGQVVDSGANIGQMTQLFMLVPGVTVHAFEPTTAAADMLEASVGANAAQNVRIIRKGLSSAPGSMPIQLDGARSTLRTDLYKHKALKTEVIELMKLDDYMSQTGLARLRLWKLDVEGHELEALDGAAMSLGRQAIDAILIEVSESTYVAVRHRLADFGYALNVISSRSELMPFSGQVRCVRNLVAVPER
jgi:FkbM family methyltransferase